jgi:DNA-binding XRE family transcriptional regulator
MGEPSGPLSGSAGEGAEGARSELGRLLARLRGQAGLSQRLLAARIGYSASVVASAEKGRPHVSARFWELADGQLNAEGQLSAGYERVRCLELWAREQDRDGEAGEGPDPAGPPGTVVPGAGRTVTTPAIGVCPSCGQPLALVAHLAVAVPARGEPAAAVARQAVSVGQDHPSSRP